MKEIFTVQEVFDLIGEEYLNQKTLYGRKNYILVDGYKVRCGSLRYMTFYQKGIQCICCGRKGSYFKLESDNNNPERKHFNLYSDDGVLMTRDHIIPKSLGGKDCIDNMQTMCVKCNENKGNNI